VATNKRSKIVSGFIIGTFVSLYLMVSVISTIHVIDFFKLSNPTWLAVSLAIAFEIGAAASLASLVAMEKMNKSLVWMLFFLLTFMQAMGNTYYAYVNIENFSSWSELFGLIEEEVIYQKRILSVVSGAILPIVALGFIKSLVDYIKPEPENSDAPEKYQEDVIGEELVNGQQINTEEESDELDSDVEYYYDLQDSSIGNYENINEPLVHDLGNSQILNDENSEDVSAVDDYSTKQSLEVSSDSLIVTSSSDLPDYQDAVNVDKKPLIQNNEEIVNVNQNKENLGQRNRPVSKEAPTSLDANPTRI
jgi:hypothetical protein